MAEDRHVAPSVPTSLVLAGAVFGVYSCPSHYCSLAKASVTYSLSAKAIDESEALVVNIVPLGTCSAVPKRAFLIVHIAHAAWHGMADGYTRIYAFSAFYTDM